MTDATAHHLNRLRLLSRPIESSTNGGWPDFTCPDDIRDNVAGIANAILVRHRPAAQAAEIRAAAKEGRIAETTAAAFVRDVYGVRIRDTGLVRALWGIAKDEVLAAFAADNARRLAEYEAYRIACEQGVAVPPQG